MLILRNQSGQALCPLAGATGVSADIKYNEVSTLEFTVASHVDGQPTEGYGKIAGMRIVDLVGFGQFVLMNPETSNDGVVEKKKCTCYSLEYEFTNKQIFIENGTYNFWNPHAPDLTVLGMILEAMPSWSAGSVASSLVGKWRTYEVHNENCYNFIKGTLQKAYNCIFDFDTYNRLVHVRDASALVPSRSVYISHENLAKKIDIKEDTDSIVTVLDVNGADGVNIRDVNPDGTNKMVNLDYFMTPDNFAPGVIQKYHAWRAAYRQNRQPYYNLSVEYALQAMRLTTEQAALVDMFGSRTSAENIKATILQGIAAGTHTQGDLTNVNAEIASWDAKMGPQQALTASIAAGMAAIHANRIAINNAVKFASYFTAPERLLLDRYFKEDSIEESSFVVVEARAYAESGSTHNLLSTGVSVAGAGITGVTTGAGKTVYDITGGTLSIPGRVSGAIRRGALEVMPTGAVVMTAMLNAGVAVGESFPSGSVSITGAGGAVSDDMAPDPDGPGLTIGTRVSFTLSTGCLYFTRNVSEYERHAVSWDLYQYGEALLEKLSQPTFHFSVSSGNFLRAEGFELFRDSLRLGDKIYLKIGEGEVLKPIAVGAKFSFTDYAGLELSFSDSYLAGDSAFQLADLLEQSISMGKSLDYNRYTYAAFVDSGAQSVQADGQLAVDLQANPSALKAAQVDGELTVDMQGNPSALKAVQLDAHFAAELLGCLSALKAMRCGPSLALEGGADHHAVKAAQADGELAVDLQGSPSAVKAAQCGEALEAGGEIRLAPLLRFYANSAFACACDCALGGRKKVDVGPRFSFSGGAGLHAKKNTAAAGAFALDGGVGFELLRCRTLGEMGGLRLGDLDGDTLHDVDFIAI